MLQGKVQTVLGPIDPEQVGICLMHEHLLLDYSSYRFTAPPAAGDRRMVDEPITLENLSAVRYNWTGSRDNLRLTDEASAISGALEFKASGGNTIVEVSNIGLARDPLGLARIARTTGLNIVMGAGYYEGGSHPPDMATKSVEQIADEIIRDITEGVGNTGVRSGIIGEVGCTWPLSDGERKSLQGAAKAQEATGAPITIHPGRHPKAPAEIMSILSESGARADRVVMGHLERTVFTKEQYLAVARLGCYLQLDTFGNESSYFPNFPIQGNYPNDGMRVDIIAMLMGEGYLERTLVSHDVCTKIQTTRYGGPGYAHILRRAVPLMRRKGITEEQIRTMLVDNTRRILEFA